MGLLHVLSEVPEDDNRCMISFTNPLLDTTKQFTIQLLRIFTKLTDKQTRNIPVEINVKDTPFFLYTNFSIPSENETIANATNSLVNVLNVDRFKNKLLTFQVYPPSTSYTNLNTNDVVTERFFNLNTSKKTHLFSNNKYILYMLGYDDNDLQKIENLNVDGNDQYFKQFLTTTDPLQSLDTIYFVKHDISSVQPKKRRNGNLKWHTDDKVKKNIFCSKTRGTINFFK